MREAFLYQAGGGAGRARCPSSWGHRWTDRGFVRHPREGHALATLLCCRGLKGDGTRKGNPPSQLRMARNRYQWSAQWHWKRNTVGYGAARHSSVVPDWTGCAQEIAHHKKKMHRWLCRLYLKIIFVNFTCVKISRQKFSHNSIYIYIRKINNNYEYGTFIIFAYLSISANAENYLNLMAGFWSNWTNYFPYVKLKASLGHVAWISIIESTPILYNYILFIKELHNYIL